MPWRLPGEFVVSCNCVRGLDGAGVVGQGQGGVERVAQECAGARAPAAREVLVDAQAGEEIGQDVAGPVQLLHGSHPVIMEAPGRAADDLPRAPPQGIVLEGATAGAPREAGQPRLKLCLGPLERHICHFPLQPGPTSSASGLIVSRTLSHANLGEARSDVRQVVPRQEAQD